ncbi:MAG TPA: type II toxin-antitoxin system prevent-host-death family antitoxin [Kofleriaceae bacterium]|nr:type II toxin-antitoxin system prevent-host-death family antitoxin [Kofleriaceae bacterium]
MRQVNVRDAEAELSRLLEQVEAGERVKIARAGEPAAVLVPYKAVVRRRRLGLARGQVQLHPDFDELPVDIAASFGAE